jgi:hypothetical protein
MAPRSQETWYRHEQDFGVERIINALDYDPETGRMSWKTRRTYNSLQGDEAGYVRGGYRCFKLHGVKFLTHRAAWVLAHGRWPEKQVDHQNGDTLDNRLSNLREVSHTQNMQNSDKGGLKGIYLSKTPGKLFVMIRRKRYGHYSTLAEAQAVAQRVLAETYGEFARS